MSNSLTCVVFGTDTGNTEEVGKKIAARLDDLGLGVDLADVSLIDLDQLLDYEFLILGIPTWDFGGIQDDWDELEDRLGQLDLSGKVVALYGLGDQHGYADYYLDAMGWLHERLAQSNATFVGRWPTEGYDFSASRAVSADGETFCGLALDDDNQFDQTDERVVKSIDQILSEYIAASS